MLQVKTLQRLETWFKSKCFKHLKHGSSQNQNLAVTVHCVPSWLESLTVSFLPSLLGAAEFARYLGVNGEEDKAQLAHAGPPKAETGQIRVRSRAREGYLGVHREDDEAEFAHGGQHRAHPLAPLHVN